MIGYFALLGLIAPVFIFIAIGIVLRWRGVLQPEAERSVVALVTQFLYPCLVASALIEADSLRASPDVLAAPLVGGAWMLIGFAVAAVVAKLIGLRVGAGLRTFCFSVGISNYGYIPVPLTDSLFGQNELATLFMHNVGIELAVWTVGLAILTRASFQEGLRRAVNPMAIGLIVGLGLNVSGLAREIPPFALTTLRMLGGCAIPIGIIAIGSTMYEFLRAGDRLWDTRANIAAVIARLVILPLIGLAIARYAPLSIELKRVLVIQAAMPAGVMPIVLAKHFGGQPLVAARVVISTTVVGVALMPFWIDVGLRWVLGR